MTMAFKCRVQYNADITKIKKFFDETDTINIAAGLAGIALFATTANDSCYYMVNIHSCDIYQLHVDKNSSEIWKYEGIVRTMSAISFIAFIKNKESNDDLLFEIDDNATMLRLSVVGGMNSNNVVRFTEIPLTTPQTLYEYPLMTQANVTIKVNEFKKLCSEMSKTSSEIKIESQDNAVRLRSGDSAPTCYGSWSNTAVTHECCVKNTAFLKATKINIGNTKNSQAGLYIYPEYPLMIKVKLGSVDFLIYAKKWVNER